MPDPDHVHPPLLAARGLRFTRNEAPVFGPLDFAVDAGEALLVQGDNGAGKTTLLRVLAGLLPADTGAVDAVQRVGVHRRGRRPQAEGSVDVHPRAVLVRDPDGILEVVEGA